MAHIPSTESLPLCWYASNNKIVQGGDDIAVEEQFSSSSIFLHFHVNLFGYSAVKYKFSTPFSPPSLTVIVCHQNELWSNDVCINFIISSNIYWSAYNQRLLQRGRVRKNEQKWIHNTCLKRRSEQIAWIINKDVVVQRQKEGIGTQGHFQHELQ